jgi:hypothetical protein
MASEPVLVDSVASVVWAGWAWVRHRLATMPWTRMMEMTMEAVVVD